MEKTYQFETVLIRGSMGLFAEFPFDCQKEFGSRRAIRVKVTIKDKTFKMSLLPGGRTGHWLQFKKETRELIGKEEGDSVWISLEQDFEIPEIEIPEYLAWLLENEPEQKKLFDKLPVSARKFWVENIEETKNDETKVERINKMFEYLRSRP